MSLSFLLRDRRIWLVAGALALILAVRASGLGEMLSLETLRVHRGALVAWVGEHRLLAALAFVAVYAGATAFSVPGAVFLTLSGGFLFGAGLGTLLTVIGATIGATLVFLFARSLFGDNAIDRFGPQARKLADGIRRNAASYLLVLRLVPIFPFFLINLVPAFVGVRLSTYVLTTFFGIIPGTAVFSLSGAGLGEVLDRGGEFSVAGILTPQIVAALVGLAALSLAAIPIRRRLEARAAAAEALARENPTTP
jgi:uncharacterized membrane protein YdjX (TVP38/TMEM64 family)